MPEPTLVDVMTAIGRVETKVEILGGTVACLSTKVDDLQMYKAEQEGVRKFVQPWRKAVISWLVPALFSTILAGAIAVAAVKLSTPITVAQEIKYDANNRGTIRIK